MKHCWNYAIIQNIVIAIYKFENLINAINRFPENSSDKNTGNIQITCNLSNKSEFTVFFILSNVVYIYFLDSCINS